MTLLTGMITNLGYMDCTRLSMIGTTTLTIEEAVKPLLQCPCDLPVLIGACDDIYLDPSGSLGDGSRPWESITWDVAVDIPNNDTAEAIRAEGTKAEELMVLLSSAYTVDDIGYIYKIDNEYIWPFAATYTSL